MDYGFRKTGPTKYKQVLEYTHPTYGVCFTATSNVGGKKFSVTRETPLDAAKALDLYMIKQGRKQVNNTYTPRL